MDRASRAVIGRSGSSRAPGSPYGFTYSSAPGWIGADRGRDQRVGLRLHEIRIATQQRLEPFEQEVRVRVALPSQQIRDLVELLLRPARSRETRDTIPAARREQRHQRDGETDREAARRHRTGCGGSDDGGSCRGVVCRARHVEIVKKLARRAMPARRVLAQRLVDDRGDLRRHVAANATQRWRLTVGHRAHHGRLVLAGERRVRPPASRRTRRPAPRRRRARPRLVRATCSGAM